MIFSFENYELDAASFALRKDGEPCAIEPKAFDLLRLLVENHDRLVSKDEIQEKVWQGRIVSEATVASCVNTARRAVGDTGKEQRLIQTVPRRGFRFVGSVETERGSHAGASEDSPAVISDNAEPVAPHHDAAASGEAPERPSIAVLPFENLSGDREQEYFADGIAEDLTTALSRFRWFFVIARNSSFSYKGTSADVRRVAEDLNVRYVLEGSVRKGDTRVRIAVQLVDALTGRHLWADRYDRELSDIFAVQDEITQKIAAIIAPTIERSEYQRIVSVPPNNLAAWEYCLKGNALIYEMSKAAILGARKMFGQAIELDPTYSRAYSGLAFTYSIGLRFLGDDDRAIGAERLFEAAQSAVALDESDSKARTAMALAYMYATPPQSAFAVAEAKEAIALNPDDPQANSVLGVALALSDTQYEAGIPWIEKAVTINPLDPINHLYLSQLALAHLCAKKYEYAVKVAEEALRRKHGFIESHVALAAALGYLGRSDEAKNALGTFQDIAAEFVEEHLVFADEVKKKVLVGLRKANALK